MPPPHIPPVGRNLVNQRKKAGAADVTNAGGIPNEIKCHICNKVKPKSQYANRQLQKYADSIHNPYAPAGRSLKDPKTTCRTCTPQQTTELTCCVCSKTKGLTHFAKNQRKNPEIARCVRCVQMHIEAEPDGDLPDSDDYSEAESEEEYDFDDPEPKKAAQKPKVRRAMGAGTSQNNIPFYSGNEDDESPQSGNGQWENVSGTGSHQSQNRANPPLPYQATNYDNHASYPSDPTPASTNKGGWAKVKKVPAGQATKWGQPQEADEWDQYARNLANQRAAKKAPTKKKKQQVHIDSDEDENWD